MEELKKGLRRNLNIFYSYGIYFVFGFIVISMSLVTPKFYAPMNLINILVQSVPTGLAVIGVSFVLVDEGIDLSVGSNMVLSGVVAALMFNSGQGLLVGLLSAILCGVLIGGVNGFLISRFKLIPFIATLAMASVARGVSLILNKTQVIYLSENPGDFLIMTRFYGIPVVVFIFLFLVLAGQFIFRKTTFGRQLFACGNNKVAAEKVGIKVRKIAFGVYLISGIFAGISGFMTMVQISAVPPEMGMGREFIVKSAAVLGGMSLFGGKGSIFPGALVGVLIITMIENALVLLGANPYAYTVVRGIVIFLAVMIDSVRNKNKLG